jgi:bacterioferritin
MKSFADRRQFMSAAPKSERRQQVIEVLNKARSMELLAISQYMNQHYQLDDKDYGNLAAKMKLVAIDEMRHAEQFADRIYELGGEPTATLDGKVQKGQEVKEVYTFDSSLEDNTIDAYNQFLITCRDCGDSISMKLFEDIIEEEQIHFNYFDNIKGHIEDLGSAYLSQVAGTPSSTGLVHQGFAIQEKGE